MSGSVKYSRNQGVLVQQVNEQTILLNPNDGQYFALDGVGGHIWDLCDGSRTIHEMATLISRDYDAPVAVVEADVQELLADLVHEKLVIGAP